MYKDYVDQYNNAAVQNGFKVNKLIQIGISSNIV